MHSLIISSFAKIKNCEYTSAASDLMAFAKELSNSESDSDLDTADKIAKFSEFLREQPNTKIKIENLNAETEELISTLHSRIDDIFRYFESFEEISLYTVERPVFPVDSENQYPFMLIAYNEYLTKKAFDQYKLKEIIKRLENQLAFYISLSQERTFANYHFADKIIKKGKYASFVELKNKQQQYKQIISSIEKSYKTICKASMDLSSLKTNNNALMISLENLLAESRHRI
ncbi:hypothetical protein [Azotobacter chroococcum]|nr:hypothetical protein [Azotobacter chroococcum]